LARLIYVISILVKVVVFRTVLVEGAAASSDTYDMHRV
jgi:hypothetical protein